MTSLDAANSGELVSRAEFARRMGVVKSAITKAVQADRISGSALGPGKKLRFLPAEAQWNRNRGAEADAAAVTPTDGLRAKAAAGDAPAGSQMTIKADILAEDLARKRSERLEREGMLLPKAEIEATFHACFRRVRRKIEMIETWADDLAEACGGDATALRASLKAKARALQIDLADAVAALNDDEDDDAADGEIMETESDDAQAA